VAYYRRRLPTYLKAKELIDSGELGEIRYVSVELTQPAAVEAGVPEKDLPWRVRSEIAGGGLFFDLGSHMLDILDFLLGPISEVHGNAVNQAGLYRAEDIVCTSFRLASGVLGTGMWCFSVYNGGKTDQIEIVGSKGAIRFSCYEEPGLILKTADGETTMSFENPAHIQQPLIQSVVDHLMGKGKCPSTGESAARTAWVMDEMVRG
jgi:predicted dehydrogenase